MQHITVGRKYNEGKIAFVECVKGGSIDNISIIKFLKRKNHEVIK